MGDRRELLALPDDDVSLVGGGVDLQGGSYKALQQRYVHNSSSHLAVEPLTSVPRRLLGGRVSQASLGRQSGTISSNSTRSSEDTASTSINSTCV